jgi:hypothetical protein
MAGEGFALKKKGPSAGTVLANGIPVRHYPPHRKDLAIQYATDPAYRALLVTMKLWERGAGRK